MIEQNDALSGQGVEQTDPQGKPVDTNIHSMEVLLKNDAFSVELPKSGEIRQGSIASIGPGQILVSIGAKSEGIISGREFENIDAEELDAFTVGQEIPVYVLSPEDSNGNVVLSYKRALEQMAWGSVEEEMKNNEIIESKILGYNKGGLIADVSGLRGFVPASQISMARRSQAVGDTPEQRWSKMIGEPISVRIIEVDRSRRRLILSERAASNESRQSIKERVIEELEEGQICVGRVTSLADFGAFVNINGADGLVHLSELSWDRVQHPKEILEVGQEVKVKVINIDRERKRIGLSLRALSDDPWHARVEKFSVGQLTEGVITRLTKFGAFARLEGDIEGLIHISEISDVRIEHPKEVLKEGETVALRVIRIDPEQHRIGLSIRKVDSAAFADKDFKLLAQEYEHVESETEPTAEEPTESGPAPEPEAESEQTEQPVVEEGEAMVEQSAESEDAKTVEPSAEMQADSDVELPANPEDHPEREQIEPPPVGEGETMAEQSAESEDAKTVEPGAEMQADSDVELPADPEDDPKAKPSAKLDQEEPEA